ncbi:DMT family transporter [Congzhengia minquanensis]|uniref:EamA family transporter n=1 Tax=Congzhengia minquanensis TaxID=2763657 RepID=A0A926DMV5_9FIRM|nr:DMT family transporter [Congzhengia minquanensis]MBC8540609.1 EamA family transporter [Congzhengia minquanensis]
MAKNYIKYILALLLFGSNGIVASKITLESSNIVLLRTFAGSLLLIVVFMLSKRTICFLQFKKDCFNIAISGAAMGASWMLLYEAYIQIGVGTASLMYYCGPVIVMLLSPILFREKLTGIKIGSFFVVLVGILFINSGAEEIRGNAGGVVLAGMSAVMYAVMVIFNKKSVHVKGLENAMIQLFVSFLTAAVYVGCKTNEVIQINSGDWVYILILGLVNTGLGCYLYFSSIGALPVQTIAVCGYLEPLSAVLLSVFVLKETLLPMHILGAVFILGGAVFAEIFGHRKTGT